MIRMHTCPVIHDSSNSYAPETYVPPLLGLVGANFGYLWVPVTSVLLANYIETGAFDGEP